MKKYFFMASILQLLSQGKFLTKVFAVTLRFLMAVIIFTGLVYWVMNWKSVIELPPAGIIGGIIFQISFVIAIYMVTHAMFIRACKIESLPESEFMMIPLMSILLRLFGEIYASFVAVVAVGGGVFTWFTVKSPATILGTITSLFPHIGDETFLGGLVFILGGILVAGGVFTLSYFLSEMFLVMVDLVRNLRITRQIVEQSDRANQK